MKTHDIAKMLNNLAKLLRAGPNVEIDNLTNFPLPNAGTVKPPNVSPNSTRDVAADGVAALSILAELSKIDKREWIKLIDDLDLPIAYRDRDATRDIIGKLMTQIDRDPAIRRRIRNYVVHKDESVSGDLLNVFRVLLNE
ncbi:hypothetical protein [Bremerella sp.]|uniref:hypothetical protein n=1 Tax=Bremerella sp. TaxID=2795602 RepID=UPI00391AE28C